MSSGADGTGITEAVAYVKRDKDLLPMQIGGEVVSEIFGAAVGTTTKSSTAKIRIHPGNSSKPHYHPVVEETYYILSGSGKMIINGKEIAVGPYDSVGIPVNTVHEISNTHATEDLVFIVFCAPPFDPQCQVFV